MVESLTIRRPDDWHLHFRDGDTMRAVVPHTARQFARAIVTRRSSDLIWLPATRTAV